jgi:very-short-patch-repair endonuclease
MAKTSDLEEAFAWQLRAGKLPAPVREARFHPKRRWRFDFSWPEQKLAIEIEGGVWNGGRHTTGAGFSADCEKRAEAVLLGWRVLNFPGAWVKDGRALRYAELALAQHATANAIAGGDDG